MGALLGRVVAWVLSALGVAGALTWKTFFTGLFLAALGVILHNILLHFMKDIMEWVLSQVQGVSGPNGIQARVSVSGALAWFLVQLRAPDSLSILVSCLGVRIALKCIPFLRLN